MTDFTVSLPDGARLAARETGAGDTVLLVSGLGGTGAFWAPVTAGLQGKRCVVFDQRGVAGSTRGQAAVDIARLAADAWAVLDARGIERVHLVGHSTGGCIVQEMALSAPARAASLVLGGTWGGRNAYMQSLFAMRAALLQASPALYEQAGAYLSYPAAWLLAHPEAVPAEAPPWPAQRVAVVRERIAALLAYDRLDDLPRLDVPALVLGARDDQIVPFALQQQLARVLPRALLRPLEHGGHFFPIVRGADYIAALLDWLGYHSP